MYITGVLVLLCLFASDSFAWQGKVVAVKDGDSITVFRKGTKVEVRLHGVDTPERGQPFGNKAKKFTRAKVWNRQVEVEPTDTDRYGRTVALVTVDGENLNEALVRGGYAWVYRNYCKNWYCGAWLWYEREARKEKAGLWAGKEPVPPWEWRHGRKNRDWTADRAVKEIMKRIRSFLDLL